MMISGFGMCNGYYRELKTGTCDLNKFYSKRYRRTVPFFAILILLDLVIEFSPETLCEGFMEITMLFGFLPNNTLSTIGVAWTLGAIFAFYIIFPFIVFLLYNKKRGIMSFVISLAITYMCQCYFMTDRFVTEDFVMRHSFLYCLPFFLIGGIVYLYKDEMNNFLPINQEYKAYYEHDNYILYFGRYAREKGVLTILKAYAKMHCDEKLVLVGKGSEEERIKNFVKEHNLEGRVQVNGAIFGEEMDRIIERAKVVLVPSEWYENGAFVALQALAKGKIVVASDIAGLSEIVQDGETGYLAEPGNPDSFAIAIQKALNLTETEYRNMSARIVAYAKKRCDAENYIEKLCKIYEELINGKQHKENG